MSPSLLPVRLRKLALGLVLVAAAGRLGSLEILYVVLPVCVVGFSALTPSLQSLLSRHTPASEQGGTLGLGQSMSSLARILGPMAGVPLVENRPLAERLGVKAAELPLVLAAAMMTLGLVLIVTAARRGRDFGAVADVDIVPNARAFADFYIVFDNCRRVNFYHKSLRNKCYFFEFTPQKLFEFRFLQRIKKIVAGNFERQIISCEKRDLHSP